MLSEPGASSNSAAKSKPETGKRKYNQCFLDRIEDIEDYQPGGLHPTNIGDVFNNRYKVLHKLGYGNYSTVWLASDDHASGYVALKIIRAADSKNYTEPEVLKKLESGPADHPGKNHVAALKTSFKFDGPNGRHLCLVSEVAGPSISGLRYEKPTSTCRLRADIARKVARQTAEALDFIHSQGFCHGDLTSSNILLRIASLDMWSIEEIYERFKEPHKDEVQDIYQKPIICESAPLHLIEPAPPLDAEFLVANALLVDYGHAFPIDTPPEKELISIPYHYAAPEFILDGQVSVKSDIWSLGCVLYEIRAGQQLFEDWFDSDNEVLSQFVHMLGKMPDPWWEAWEKKSLYFNEDGSPIQDDYEEWPLGNQIADIGHESPQDGLGKEFGTFFELPGISVSAEEAFLLKDLLEGIFKWEPEDRISLSDILKHPWFSL